MADRSGAKLWLWLILGAAVLGVSIKMGPWSGAINWYQLRYFTTLSNILAEIYALWALARGRSRVSALFHGTVLLGVLVTGIIYHLLLGRTFGGFPLFSLEWLGNQLVHTAVPLLMLLDWLIFAPKGRFGPVAPLGWALFPLAYFGGTMAAAELGMYAPNSNIPYPYPYPFLDVWVLGWGRVARNVILIALAFLALGSGIAAVDRAMKKQTDVVNK